MELPWWATFVCGGAAASIAEIVTLPIDTAKVRLQLLRKTSGVLPGAPGVPGAPGGGVNLGMVGMMRKIVLDEGVLGLYKGVWPAIQRQLVFASLRVGIYKEISERLREPNQAVTLERKILAGLLSGAIGITVANPTDLVKVRMQSEGRLGAGQAPRYTGVMNAYATIVRTEGVRGLWTGWGPNVARNSIINATELATYEQCKESLLAAGWGNTLPTHVTAAACSGIMATIVGNPIDVIKTRVMAAAGTGESAVGTLLATLRNEGPLAFYQGVLPQFFRLTGWSLVMFVSLEQLKGGMSVALGARQP